MNIVKALEGLNLTGWSWRGNPEVSRPVITEGSEQTQEQADTSLIGLIEWNGEAPLLTWEQLQVAAASVASSESAAMGKHLAYQAAIATGYDTGLGFFLAVGRDDSSAFIDLLFGLQVLGMADDYLVEDIKDKDGGRHDLTLAQLKTIMQGYLPFCFNLWRQVS